MTYKSDQKSEDQARLALLLYQRDLQWKIEAQDRLRDAKKRKRPLTPELVADFAFVHFQDDQGRPIKPAPHHWLWLALLCNRDIKKLFIKAPPESAKTTWVLAYLGASIAFHPEWPRIIATASGDVAERRSLALKTLVESVDFQQTFPDVKRADGLAYGAKGWSLATDGTPYPGRIHPTVAAYGARGPITGSRAMEALADDVLDEENTRTAYMRDSVDTWLHRSFLSRVMSRTGRSIVIGTAWHHDDSYSRLEENPGWTFCHLPLLSDGEAVTATIRYADSYKGHKMGTAVSNLSIEAPA